MFHSSVGHILKDTLSYVSPLQSYSFFHVGWQGNIVTYVLVQRARLSFPLIVWMKYVPPDLDSFVLYDLSTFD